MTNNIRAKANDVSRDIYISIQSLGVPVAKAATMAIKDAAAQLKLLARAQIRQALSSRMANAYRVTVYPQKGYSIDAAAFGIFKGVDYSDILQTGGTIKGKPLLWIPFSTTPKIDRRKTAADISDYRKARIEMESFTSKSGKPILGVKILMTKSAANRRTVRLSIGDIRAGAKGKRAKQGRGRGLVQRTVPLFFGIPSVTLKKKLDIYGVQEKVQAMVPAFYSKAIERLADE